MLLFRKRARLPDSLIQGLAEFSGALSLTNPLSITSGGTGATTAEGLAWAVRHITVTQSSVQFVDAYVPASPWVTGLYAVPYRIWGAI